MITHGISMALLSHLILQKQTKLSTVWRLELYNNWIQISIQLSVDCVTWGKLLSLSVPQCLHWLDGSSQTRIAVKMR